MQSSNILLVDDDKSLIELLHVTLEESGYRICEAYTGSQAVKLFNENPPALVMLDINLPDISGYEVCRTIRQQSKVPIMALSGLIKEEQISKCFDLGMDDYIAKPFGTNELLARTKALLKEKTIEKYSAPYFYDGYLNIDYLTHRVKIAEKDVVLTPKEFNLLKILTQQAGTVIEYEKLVELVWDSEFKGDTEILYRHISLLHKKIEPQPEKPQYIVNVAKFGYRYEIHK